MRGSRSTPSRRPFKLVRRSGTDSKPIARSTFSGDLDIESVLLILLPQLSPSLSLLFFLTLSRHSVDAYRLLFSFLDCISLILTSLFSLVCSLSVSLSKLLFQFPILLFSTINCCDQSLSLSVYRSLLLTPFSLSLSLSLSLFCSRIPSLEAKAFLSRAQTCLISVINLTFVTLKKAPPMLSLPTYLLPLGH